MKHHRPYWQEGNKNGLSGFLGWFTVFSVENDRLKSVKKQPRALSFCIWHSEHGWLGWQKCKLRHEPTFFSSSLLKSEPSWLHPEELTFWNKKLLMCFCCLNIDRTTLWNLRVENICTFSTVSGQLCLGSPLITLKYSVIHTCWKRWQLD